jgi:hypothetical protein
MRFTFTAVSGATRTTWYGTSSNRQGRQFIRASVLSEPPSGSAASWPWRLWLLRLEYELIRPCNQDAGTCLALARPLQQVRRFRRWSSRNHPAQCRVTQRVNAHVARQDVRALHGPLEHVRHAVDRMRLPDIRRVDRLPSFVSFTRCVLANGRSFH